MILSFDYYLSVFRLVIGDLRALLFLVFTIKLKSTSICIKITWRYTLENLTWLTSSIVNYLINIHLGCSLVVRKNWEKVIKIAWATQVDMITSTIYYFWTRSIDVNFVKLVKITRLTEGYIHTITNTTRNLFIADGRYRLLKAVENLWLFSNPLTTAFFVFLLFIF